MAERPRTVAEVLKDLARLNAIVAEVAFAAEPPSGSPGREAASVADGAPRPESEPESEFGSPRRDAIAVSVRKAIDEGDWDTQDDVSRTRALCERLLWFADELLEAPQSADAFLQKTWLMADFKRPVVEKHRFYVELLTAAWLGLYFLGIPVADLWDRVRRWEDEEGGGLPNGICVAKAIGDIVRESRKAQMDKPARVNADGAYLHVHSFLPMLMFPELIATGVVHPDQAPPTSLLEEDVHALGRHYEFLQLKQYVRARLPILYSVPLALLRSGIDRNGKTLEHRRERWEEMWTSLRSTVFPDCDRDYFDKKHQRVVLAEPSTPPACFLNHDTGLLTFEGMDATEGSRDIPLPAGYMRAARLGLYRDRLIKFEQEASLVNLLAYDNGAEAFEVLYKPDGTPLNPYEKSASTAPAPGAALDTAVQPPEAASD